METTKKNRRQSRFSRARSEPEAPSSGNNSLHPEALAFLHSDLLQAHQQDKKEFFTSIAVGVAHEINNLLVGAIGAANLAASNTETSELLRDELRLIEKAGGQIAEFVERLTLAAEKGIYHFKKVDIAVLLQNVLQSQSPPLPAALQLHQHISNNLPAVSGDAEKLEKVLRALLTNAFEACESRGDCIQITLCQKGAESLDSDLLCWPLEKQARDLIALSVEDNGCGMPEDILMHVFDPFFTTKFPGRGLGLAMAAGVLKRHGGSIAIASRQRDGATFTLYLPVAP